jgi:hypothetical protein
VNAVITESGISIELQPDDSGNREIGYSAVPTVDGGKLKLSNVESHGGFVEHVLPKDKLANAVEDGVNGALAERNLVITDITLRDGAMILTTAPAS